MRIKSSQMAESCWNYYRSCSLNEARVWDLLLACPWKVTPHPEVKLPKPIQEPISKFADLVTYLLNELLLMCDIHHAIGHPFDTSSVLPKLPFYHLSFTDHVEFKRNCSKGLGHIFSLHGRSLLDLRSSFPSQYRTRFLNLWTLYL